LGDHGVVQPGAALVDAVDPDDRVEALVQEGEDAHALGELLGVLSTGEDAGPPFVRLPVVAERTDFRPGLDLERDALRATLRACLARGSHHVLRFPRVARAYVVSYQCPTERGPAQSPGEGALSPDSAPAVYGCGLGRRDEVGLALLEVRRPEGTVQAD